MQSHELYQKLDPTIVSNLFLWMREADRKLYTSTLASLAADRKLRPIFLQKKSVPDQITWLHDTLKLKSTGAIGEHLLQVWFMHGKQDVLIEFCDGLGISHNGKGAVEGDLPETLDDEKLNTTIDSLLEKHSPQLITLYLQLFNLQIENGWPNLTSLLDSNPRLKLGS